MTGNWLKPMDLLIAIVQVTRLLGGIISAFEPTVPQAAAVL